MQETGSHKVHPMFCSSPGIVMLGTVVLASIKFFSGMYHTDHLSANPHFFHITQEFPEKRSDQIFNIG